MLQYQILIKIQGHRVIMTDQVKKADKKANNQQVKLTKTVGKKNVNDSKKNKK